MAYNLKNLKLNRFPEALNTPFRRISLTKDGERLRGLAWGAKIFLVFARLGIKSYKKVQESQLCAEWLRAQRDLNHIET